MRFISRYLVLLPALALLAAAGPLRAQQSDTFTGRVRLGERFLPGVEVTLHRVTADSSGAIETTTSDADGAFLFRLPPATGDGFTVFFTTADFRSVRYFGLPLHSTDSREGYTIQVFDTTSALAGGVRVARRDMVMIPHTDGGWEVNEVVRILNSADRTLVAGSDGGATWEVPLPEGLEAFEAAEGDIPADRVRWMGERLLVLSPITPGEHEVYYRYRLPATLRGTGFDVGAGVDSVNVYVLQPAPRVTVEGLTATEILTVEGQRFLRYGGADLAPGSAVRLEWGGGAPPLSPVLAGVGATLLLLLVGLAASMRGRGGAGRPVPTASGA